MSTEWWGYISIDAESIPLRLSNTQPLFLDRAWVRGGYGDFWIPWECNPNAEVRAAFADAKAKGEINEYRIHRGMPVI